MPRESAPRMESTPGSIIQEAQIENLVRNGTSAVVRISFRSPGTREVSLDENTRVPVGQPVIKRELTVSGENVRILEERGNRPVTLQVRGSEIINVWVN